MTSMDDMKLFNPFAWAKRPLDAATALPNFLEFARKVSEQARSNLRSKTFSYGPTSEQRLEWFTVDGSETVFVFLHGGAWQAGDVSSSAFMAESLARRGIETVVLGYDVCPQVTLRELMAQVHRGFDVFLANHRPGTRIFVCGISAGAHLAATLLASYSKDPRITGYVLLGGLYDLTKMASLPLGKELRMTLEDAPALSPMEAKDLTAVAKVLLTIGEDDSPYLRAQSEAFGEKLRNLGFNVVQRLEEGLDHLHLSEDMAREDSSLMRVVCDFMGV